MAEKRGRKIHDFPGKAKSQVWKHFGFYAVEGDGPLKLDKEYTICKICETAIKFTGGTTNQQNHIDKKHGTFAAPKSGLNMLKQSTLTEMRDAQTKLSFHSHKAMEVTKAICEHLVLDMRPLSVVESPSFRNILAKAEPRYDVPSRTYYKDTFIPKLYETTKSVIISELCDAIGGVSITTDCWTSSATQSYMTVTAHFVTKTHKLKSYVLQTREVSERHSAENLASELQNCADDLGLERPPVVSDNAANILKAVRLLGWRSIPCLAHTINLAAKSGLRVHQVSRILAKSRDLVSYFKRYAYGTSVLHKKQELLQIPVLSLINDVDTRWNSTYDMLERLLGQTAAIHATFTDPAIKKDRLMLFTADEQASAEELLLVLKELKTATTIVCEQRTPSISMVQPVLLKLKRSLVVQEHDSALVKAVKTAALQNLETRYIEDNLVTYLNAASLLDPRYKDMPMSEESKNAVHKFIIESIEAMPGQTSTASVLVKKETETEAADVLPPLPTLPSLPTLTELPREPKLENSMQPEILDEIPAKKIKTENESSCFLDDWFSDVIIVKEEKKTCDQEAIIRDEIVRYMTVDRVSSKIDPIAWWKGNSMLFPSLSCLAGKILSTPATSVPSERVFSAAGFVVNKQRSSLAPENVDRLIFLNKNYKLL